jgi:hypothetical protein
MEVRMFPEFRCSVVKYDNNLFIPMELSPKDPEGGLVMIGLTEHGNSHFYKFPNSVMDDLQPFGNLDKFIVVGIKEKKLQIIPTKYMVVGDSKLLCTIPM